MSEELNLDDATIGLDNEEAFDASLIIESGEADLPVAKLVDTTPPPSKLKSPGNGSETLLRQPQWVGKRLGKFRLQRLLGEGSMGRVIQAEDVHLHRLVALKVLRKKIRGVGGGKQVEQFLREARAAAQIDHPNIVRIYEINEVDGWWYIAMEYIEGDTLTRVVKATGPMRPDRACAVLADAATALAVTHELGIIHRDVKPNNLMITRAGRCKLTDFGLVRVDDPNDPFRFTDKSVGTPQYMPPEIIQHKDQTPAVDVYSLGGTLYYALTGRPPYVAKTVMKILKMQLDAPPPDPRRVNSKCPDSLAKLVMRAMAKRAEDRPTAADFAAALRAEAIDFRQDESTIASGLYGFPHGAMYSASGSHSAIHFEPRRSRIYRIFTMIVMLIAAAVGGATVLALLEQFNVMRVFHRGIEQVTHEPLDARFPNAPATYGIRDSLPMPVSPLQNKPPFSWVGKVDVTGIHYVASKEGLHYYRIDDPQAALIRADLFVGYQTQEQARADGKVPASSVSGSP